MVKLTTNFGEIVLELDAARAPLTVANFLQYVKEGFYNGTIFHRVIDGFMIQGGGFEIAEVKMPNGGIDKKMRQKSTRAPIKIESDNGLKNDAYTIAMARTSIPDSATCQFFINVANNGFLNYTAPTTQGYGYCVFGKVVQGQDTVDRIKKSKVDRREGHDDVPLVDVVIEKAEILE
ncbi:MAG: peptidylprolyl isomerase [Pseudomonadota bacterium]